MGTGAADRLKLARRNAGYTTTTAAAKAFGWQEPGYRHHENGTREYFSADNLTRYARAFRVSPAWLAGIDTDMADALERISSENFGQVIEAILQAFAPDAKLQQTDLGKLGQALRYTIREMLLDDELAADPARSALVAKTTARGLLRQN
jgi:hypothetical protein